MRKTFDTTNDFDLLTDDLMFKSFVEQMSLKYKIYNTINIWYLNPPSDKRWKE